MLKLKEIVDFERDDLTHMVLIIGQERAGAVLSAYMHSTGVRAVLKQITVNTTQESIDELVASDGPYVLFVNKSPCETLESLQRRLKMEGYLDTLLDSVSKAYQVYDTLDLYALAA